MRYVAAESGETISSGTASFAQGVEHGRCVGILIIGSWFVRF
ncbi:MAG: hypothetical protein ACI8P9_001813 [Parasphingorhabdus sp.]|jgi:hypothetical protein